MNPNVPNPHNQYPHNQPLHPGISPAGIAANFIPHGQEYVGNQNTQQLMRVSGYAGNISLAAEAVPFGTDKEGQKLYVNVVQEGGVDKVVIRAPAAEGSRSQHQNIFVTPDPNQQEAIITHRRNQIAERNRRQAAEMMAAAQRSREQTEQPGYAVNAPSGFGPAPTAYGHIEGGGFGPQGSTVAHQQDQIRYSTGGRKPTFAETGSDSQQPEELKEAAQTGIVGAPEVKPAQPSQEKKLNPPIEEVEPEVPRSPEPEKLNQTGFAVRVANTRGSQREKSNTVQPESATQEIGGPAAAAAAARVQEVVDDEEAQLPPAPKPAVQQWANISPEARRRKTVHE